MNSQYLPEMSLLKKYLSSFETKNTSEYQNELFEDTFSQEIKAFLEQFKATIHVEYTIAGLSIDLLLENNNICLGIDLIGYPGSFTAAFDIERYRILHRVGIQIVPVSYLSWTYHQEETKKFLKEMIKPLTEK
ncbi:hypothetical protein [Tenacibaculum xiamenense]|uniref:hypothetical protein n=1 Tax=Tenacibaculum xiamenense TaxID=1261553 RepID=UPI0038B53B9E